MPAWIHDRAEHIRKKNPSMPKSQAFAIATQQSHATGHTPAGYGTAEGRKKAKQKYDKPAEYTQTADPSSKSKKAAADPDFLAFLMGSTTATHDGDAEMLKTKLAGSQTHLAAAISSVLDETRAKMKMAAEAKAEEKESDEKKVKKLVDYEKKEHGHLPSVKEEKDEKKEEKAKAASVVIDPQDPEEVEKLASALDSAADLLTKEADAVDNGKEHKQGGEQLANNPGAAGSQPVPSKGKAKKPEGMSAKPTDAPHQGTNETDLHHTPGSGKGYPAKGVLKTGAAIDALKAVVAAEAEKVAFSVTPEGHKHDAERAEMHAGHEADIHRHNQKHGVEAYRNDKGEKVRGSLGKALRGYGAGHHERRTMRHEEYVAKKHKAGKNAYNPFGGMLTPSKHEGKGATKLSLGEIKSKKASADDKTTVESPVDYILGKIAAAKTAGAELGGEAKQGGETLASHDKPKMVPGRALIQNAQNLKNVTKPEAKAPRKAELAQVLTEPYQGRGANDQVKQNLRSSAKGGVKTAAAKALLAKIAEEGCKCESKGTCAHCKMKKAAADIRGREAKQDE
jgi:hypothetical protein